jgi:hypothetical protein
MTPLVHPGAWQNPPGAQSPSAQSVSTSQDAPAAHVAHTGPPQSTSVSVPFCTPSAQSGAAQNPALHRWLEQSASETQTRPGGQSVQAAPPQSMSVSAPFLMPSRQVGA